MRDGSPPQTRRNSGGNSEASEREARESDPKAFARLFGDAYRRCFSRPFTAPLTESESHRFSVEIAESTGLELGWKSLKNYSSYLLGSGGRTENPSVPTLDTLARYVAGAPTTTEEHRRTRERHYPYWFRYRDALRRTDSPDAPATRRKSREVPDATSLVQGTPARTRPPAMLILVAVVAAVAFASWLALRYVAPSLGRAERFADEFDDVSEAGLASRGWSVQAVDSAHWSRRGAKPGHLTLFTLPGDNWPQPGRAPVIRNLLVRRLPSPCFVAEVRLTAFVPRQNWQQAGILLLEDTVFAGRSVRASIGFNDFAGGFPETREIIVQAITALGRESSKPEEVVHHRLFVDEPATAQLVRQNLEHSALRLEKRGAQLRFLTSAGEMRHAAFREVGRAEFDFRPAYVAVFAIEGFVPRSEDAAAHLDAFSLSELSCSP